MTVRGKGEHERVLPVTEETLEMLLRVHPRWIYWAPVIPNYQRPSQHLQPKRVGDLASKALHRGGVAASCHALRHTMATDMLDDSDGHEPADLRDVQQALGHRSMQTTSRYWGHASTERLRRSMGGRRYLPGLVVVPDEQTEAAREVGA